MREAEFSLHPFPGSRVPGVSIAGTVSRNGALLALRYTVRGDLTAVVLPPAAAPPQRRSQLWTATCFELFVAPPQAPQYWEFNLAPSGDWNVYRFAGYRRGMHEESEIASLPASIHATPDQLCLRVAIDLPPMLADQPALEIGATAVIESRDGGRTYWALAHPGPEPDFHRREAFRLRLDPAG